MGPSSLFNFGPANFTYYYLLFYIASITCIPFSFLLAQPQIPAIVGPIVGIIIVLLIAASIIIIIVVVMIKKSDSKSLKSGIAMHGGMYT